MRKRLLHIIYLAFTALLFSCSSDVVDGLPLLTRAQLSIGLVDNGEEDRQEEIKSIRFIVFSNASGDVKLNVNELIKLDTPGTATDITAQVLKVTPNDDMMVIVIANEPQGLASALSSVTSSSQLREINYDIATILDDDGEIVSTTGMPMTGVIRDISVASDQTKTVEMVIERAVARVDIFLEAIDGGAMTGYTAGSTTVTLHNFTHGSYFVMGNEANGTRDNTDPSKNYGKVKGNVPDSDLSTETWTASTSEMWAYSSATGAKNRKLLSSFYVAERTFRSDYSDRLAVSMANVLKGPPDVTGVTEKVIETITKVDDKGTPVAQPFTEIRRNNVYQITARVGKIGIQILTITVEDWGEVKNIELNMDL